MEPDEYRRRSLEIAAATAAYVRTLFQLLPADVDLTAWRRFIATIYPEVMAGRQRAFNLATEYYDSQRPRDAAPMQHIERSYPVERLQKALAPARARLKGLEEFQAAERELAAKQAASITSMHVQAAGRQNVEDSVKNDPRALGYVRGPSGAETCAFCTMLASRGPVLKHGRTTGLYRSAFTAKFTADGEPYHDDCDCQPIPVFNLKNWPDKDRNDAAEALWKESTAGFTGRDALNALRRRLYAQSAS